MTGLAPREQGPIFLVGLGHGGIHWIAATLYVILPYAATSLGWSYTQAGTLVAVFHTATFAANAVSGAAADLGGRRIEVQIVALVLGMAGLLAMALLGELGVAVLFVSVAVMGLSNNLWHPAAISYLGARFPANRGYALSIHAIGANVGDALAPLAVGGLLTLWSWRASAGVSALFALLPIALIFLFLLPRERSNGATTVSSASVTTLADYWRQLKTVIADRAIVALCLMAGIRTMAQNGLLVFLPLYLSHQLGLHPAAMGLVLAVMQASGIFAALLAGALSDRTGRRPIVVGGLACASIVIFFIPTLRDLAAPLIGAGILGLALFAVRPVVHSWLMDLAPPAMAGSSAAFMFALQGGFSIFVPLFGGMIADRFGFTPVFWLLGGAMAITTIIAALVPRRRAAHTALTD